MEWRFEQVAGPFNLTEGPVWNGERLLFTAIYDREIKSFDPSTGECSVFAQETGNGNGMFLDQQRNLLVCEGAGRRVARYQQDGQRVTLASHFEGRRLNQPNDIVADNQGRIWFTDPCYYDRESMELDHESVYRLDPESDGSYSMSRVTFDTLSPNGLVFSPDQTTLYVAEAPSAPRGQRELRAYPVQSDGSLGEPKILHDFGPHRGIDGMRIDKDGNVVAACGWPESGPGARIAVFSPSGEVLEDHAVPTSPTNCCFGDSDLQTLYVTGYDGCLYRGRTDRKGYVQ